MMNHVVTLMDRVAEAWSLFAVHAGWQAAVVAAVALGVVIAGRRWPAPLRQSILLLALLKFAMPPLLAVPTGLFTWSGPVVHEQPVVPAVPARRDAAMAPSRESRPAEPRNRDWTMLGEYAPQMAQPVAGRPAGGTPGAGRVSSAPAPEVAAPLISVGAVPSALMTWKAWFMLGYAVVALGMALRIGWELLRLRRLLRAARRIETGPLHDLLITTAGRLGVRRNVRLLVTDVAISPMAVGVLRPAVVLPAGIAERGNGDELGMILAHELAHHRRGDLIVNWFELLLRVVWWFHPLFWLLDRQVRRTREDCCDDLVLFRGMADRRGYCDALLAAARQITRPVPVGATLGMAERLHPLGRRLGRIMDGSLPRAAGLSLGGAVALLIAALVILPGLRTEAQGAAEASSTAPAGLGKGLMIDLPAHTQLKFSVKDQAVVIELAGPVDLTYSRIEAYPDHVTLWHGKESSTAQRVTIGPISVYAGGATLTHLGRMTKLLAQHGVLQMQSDGGQTVSVKDWMTLSWDKEMAAMEPGGKIDNGGSPAGVYFGIGEMAPAAPGAPATQPQSLMVQVIEAGTGHPLRGAVVHLSNKPTGHDVQRADYVTDTAGHLVILPPAGPLDWLRIGVKSGLDTPLVYEFTADQTAPMATDLRFEMQPPVAIGGVVQDEQGKPIAGVNVSISGDGAVVPGSPVTAEIPKDTSTVTDAEGRWRYDLAPRALVASGEPLRLYLRFHHTDFVSDPLHGHGLYPLPTDGAKALLGLSQVTVMKKGVALGGRVLGADGKPVAGAEVGEGSFDPTMDGVRWGKADNQGRFTFLHVDPSARIVIVRSKGFAPQYKNITRDALGVPIEFHLQPGFAVRGQVVDPAGKPIGGVSVRPVQWPLTQQGILDWSGVTDQDGRFEWDGAPADEVKLEAQKEGYLEERGVTAHPAEGKAVTITLPPAPWVSGRVVDADSGQPITTFRIEQGQPTQQPGAWETEWSHWLTPQPVSAPDGRFRCRITFTWDELALRVMAPGYIPAKSRRLSPRDASEPLEFRLRRAAKEPAGRVVLPDGTAVAGATVLLTTPQHNGARIQDGIDADFLPDRPMAPASATTSADGRFSFWPEDRAWTLVVVHDRGYGMVTQQEFEGGHGAGAGDVVLQPWARVEGRYLRDGSPAAMDAVVLQVTNQERFTALVPKVTFNSTATTDSQGHFVLEHVPATTGQVARLQTGTGVHWQDRTFGTAVAPGQTAEVVIGAGGRDVVGWLELPAGARLGAMKHPTGRVGLREKAGRGGVDQARPEGSFSCSGFLALDGSFRLEAVPAGEYELEANIVDLVLNVAKPVAQVRTMVSVGAAGAAGAPVDLGAVKTTRAGEP